MSGLSEARVAYARVGDGCSGHAQSQWLGRRLAGGRDTSMRIGIEFELMRRVHTEAQRGDAEEVVARAYQARGRGTGAPPTQKCRRVAVCRTHSGTMTREPSRERLNERHNIQSSSTASLAVVMCSLFSSAAAARPWRWP